MTTTKKKKKKYEKGTLSLTIKKQVNEAANWWVGSGEGGMKRKLKNAFLNGNRGTTETSPWIVMEWLPKEIMDHMENDKQRRWSLK